MQLYKLKHSNSVATAYSVKLFFIKLVALVVAWQASYHFILKPLRIPDKFFTDTVTIAVTACINFFFSTNSHAVWIADTLHCLNLVQQSGKTLLVIYDDCNGLDLMAIYIGFLILLPYSVKRKLAFSFCGLVALMTGNVVRCVALYWIYAHHRSYFEFNHHYIFTILMYLIIFFGWVLFTRKETTVEIG